SCRHGACTSLVIVAAPFAASHGVPCSLAIESAEPCALGPRESADTDGVHPSACAPLSSAPPIECTEQPLRQPSKGHAGVGSRQSSRETPCGISEKSAVLRRHPSPCQRGDGCLVRVRLSLPWD